MNDTESYRLSVIVSAALKGETEAVKLLVRTLRRYRVASKTLITARYSDGEVDAVAMHQFVDACQEADQELART